MDQSHLRVYEGLWYAPANLLGYQRKSVDSKSIHGPNNACQFTTKRAIFWHHLKQAILGQRSHSLSPFPQLWFNVVMSGSSYIVFCKERTKPCCQIAHLKAVLEIQRHLESQWRFQHPPFSGTARHRSLSTGQYPKL
jgi:hypothetical protein